MEIKWLETLRETICDYLKTRTCPDDIGLDFTLCNATLAKRHDDCLRCWLLAISRCIEEGVEWTN
jgi:hypothetical protein